jgi:cysteine synthase A
MSGLTTQPTQSTGLRVADNILDLIGHTPMLRMTRLAPAEGRADIFAKLEFLNPGGSVKDRAALGIVREAERTGALRPGMTIVEANTGVGLALAGINRGYKVALFVPEGFAEEKCTLMRAFGATVVRTPSDEGIKGSIREAKSLAEGRDDCFLSMQFANQANPTFHHDTTARELWGQMDGRVDAFVSGVGTGGTFSGVARFLKEQDARVLTIAVETQGSVLQGGAPGPHRVEGIGVSFIPETFDARVCDEIIRVNDAEAFGMVSRLAAEEGVLGGSSAGAAVFAALAVARRLGPGKRVATIIPDSAERYLSQSIFAG